MLAQHTYRTRIEHLERQAVVSHTTPTITILMKWHSFHLSFHVVGRHDMTAQDDSHQTEANGILNNVTQYSYTVWPPPRHHQYIECGSRIPIPEQKEITKEGVSSFPVIENSCYRSSSETRRGRFESSAIKVCSRPRVVFNFYYYAIKMKNQIVGNLNSEWAWPTSTYFLVFIRIQLLLCWRGREENEAPRK